MVLHTFHHILNNYTKFSLPPIKDLCFKLDFEKSYEHTNLVLQLPFAKSKMCHASIKDCRQLSADGHDCKAVYEISLDINDSNFQFQPGDTIGVMPSNFDNEVNDIIDHLELSSLADKVYNLNLIGNSKIAKSPIHIPLHSTIRCVLKNYVEIRSVIKKLFLFSLSQHTQDETEKRTLEYLCSTEGRQEYINYVVNNRLCILDIFNTFKTCKPPVEVLLTHLPRLLPRPYSIVNSHLKNPSTLRICFSVEQLENGKKGLTTSQLEDIVLKKFTLHGRLSELSIDHENKDTVSIYLRQNINGFLAPSAQTPLIMIAAGTAISPFIGFLEERDTISHNSDLEIGEAHLFFGCKHPDVNHIYEKELTYFLERGTLNKLHLAFSRVDEKEERKYVQDVLLENAEEVVKLINSGASIFVCGDVKSMVVSVRKNIIRCLIQNNNLTEEEAEKILIKLEAEKRYVTDSWI